MLETDPMEHARRKNIFVVGLDEFNLRLLKAVPGADRYEFHPLLGFEEISGARTFDLEALLDKARRILRAFPGPVDAIIGYWDFPTVLMMPILRREFGLRGPSLESVLRCEHKYWARRVQQEAVPETVPAFAAVDPFAPDAAQRIGLAYPFWLKPIKAHSSLLGFRVSNRRDLDHALDLIRAGIDRFADPMNVILGYADIPDNIRAVDGYHCIAEQIISRGRQCTLEGHVTDGTPQIYGIVDSIRGPNRSSLERYEYPSALPRAVQARMIDAAERVIRHAGLDASAFNMEFFHDAANDRVWLLEVNARISKSHSPLFDKVEGSPHKQVLIDVALGRRPAYPARAGRFRYAAKFMPRLYGHHDDWRVRGVPDAARLREIEAAFPGTEIQLHVEDGMRLGESRHRDPYSYELAAVFMGAQSRRALRRDFKALWQAVGLHFEAGE
ncbi:ATP-grasp domain-containing protein [Roseovarius salinarum]|uniref:ATP-grasp domain-containing protein n=1 Tax=Roseovarius salinarum TaxID=1981892 RepID=UPI001E51C50C|nr:ATP-grasp domain-containing protein [Roseovarius salinarum]